MNFDTKNINGIFVFLLFSTVFVFWTVGLVWVLSLYSIGVLIKSKKVIKQKVLSADFKTHIMPLVLILISGFLFLNMVVRDGYDINRLGLALGLLFAVPIYYNIVIYGISEKLVVYSLYAVSIVGGLAGLYEYFVLYNKRVGTIFSAMVFGLIGSLLVSILMIRIVTQYHQLNRNQLILTITSLVFAVSILLVSNSRSAYLFLVLFLIFIFFYIGAWRIKRYLVSFSLIFFLIIASTFVFKESIIVKRFSTAILTSQAYLSGNSDIKSSSTIRFEMWMAGFSAFKLNPVFGVGDVKAVDVISQISKDRNYHKSITGERHLHSDYFNALARFGLVGLFLYLSVYLVALYNIHRARVLSVSAKLSCFSYVIGYLVFGLTTTNYSYVLSQILIFVGIPMLVAWIKHLEMESETS